MTTQSDSRIDTKTPLPEATLAQTRLPWTAPHLERLEGGNAEMPVAKTPAKTETEPISVVYGPS